MVIALATGMIPPVRFPIILLTSYLEARATLTPAHEAPEYAMSVSLVEPAADAFRLP